MVMGQDVSFKNKFRYILPKKRLVIVCPNELSNQNYFLLKHVPFIGYAIVIVNCDGLATFK